MTRHLAPPALGRLERHLSLKADGADRFLGTCHDGVPGRPFGGQVAALGLAAAARTVEAGWQAHSLHMTFLRSGTTTRPFLYDVALLRDGRTYASRQVDVLQEGALVATLATSFKRPEGSLARQLAMPAVPAPEDLPDPYPQWAE